MCGNRCCYKGDACRCGGCLFLGKPAFEPGQEKLIIKLTREGGKEGGREGGKGGRKKVIHILGFGWSRRRKEAWRRGREEGGREEERSRGRYTEQ